MKLKPAACAILALVPTIAACGSSQSSSPAPVTGTVTVPAPTTATGASPAAPQTPTQSTPTSPPAKTRTAPGPAFTRTTGATPAGGERSAAVAKIRGLGFTPLSTATYDPNQTLRVLIGAHPGSAGGRAQQAFFFNGPRYLGTDAAGASGMISVTGHGDTDVTLRYGIYRPSDRPCCPSGAARAVRFVLDRGRLAALDPIPAAADRR